MIDEKELINKAKEGDHVALGILYKNHFEQGIKIARQHVRNEMDAEDVYQEAFLKAMSHLDSFDVQKDFAPWLHVIIVNTAKNLVARKDNSAVSSFSSMSSEEDETPYEFTLENTDESVMPEASLEMQALREIMSGILEELPKEQREAMVLFYYKELTVKQIAELQQVSDDTVKSRLNYSRKKVKAGVEEYEKKHNIKLRSLGITPLLIIFFLSNKGKAYAATVELAAAGTSTAGVAAATTATTLSGEVAGVGAAATGFISSMGAKVAIIVGTVLLAGGVTTGAILISKASDKPQKMNISAIGMQGNVQSEASDETNTSDDNPVSAEENEQIEETEELLEPGSEGASNENKNSESEETSNENAPSDENTSDDENPSDHTTHKHFYKLSKTVASTCVTKGYDEYKCSCGLIEKRNQIAATGVHSYKASIVEPTYKDKGYTLHKCKHCDESYKDTYVNQTTYNVVNEYGWIFYDSDDGERVCGTKGSYIDFLKSKYPDATIRTETDPDTGEIAIWCE